MKSFVASLMPFLVRVFFSHCNSKSILIPEIYVLKGDPSSIIQSLTPPPHLASPLHCNCRVSFSVKSKSIKEFCLGQE